MIYMIKDKKISVQSPFMVAKICQDLLATEDKYDQAKEHFWVLHLNTRNIIQFVELVSLGCLNASIVHPREVFSRAVTERSNEIIICHNHPSGNPEPSEDDLRITQRLKQAGEILGIKIIDHLIIAKDDFISLADKKLL